MEHEPRALIVAAGIASPDACERDPDSSRRANLDLIGEILGVVGSLPTRPPIVLVSSIYVFGGECPPEGYSEADPPRPLSVYGRHKLAAEQSLRAASAEHLIVRLPWVIGNVGHPADPVVALLRGLSRGQTAMDDGVRYPTDARWIGEVVAHLLRVGATGVVHLSSSEAVSRHGLMTALLARCGVKIDLTHAPPAVSTLRSPVAPRPAHLRLRSLRTELRDVPGCTGWHQLLDRYKSACERACTSLIHGGGKAQ